MNFYSVIEKATGKVVHQYASIEPLKYGRADWDDPELFDHVPTEMPAPPVPVMFKGRRRLSKLEFLTLLSDAEYVAILTAAKQNVAVEAWLKKFELATPEPDGTSLDLDDQRTVAGIRALEDGGLLAAGRADEILRG